jgi:hypothetical protein
MIKFVLNNTSQETIQIDAYWLTIYTPSLNYHSLWPTNVGS